MSGKCKLLMASFFLIAAGCSRRDSAQTAEKPLYQGSVRGVEYHLMEGKTVLVDDQGGRHSIDGFPMMVKADIKLSGGGEHGYDLQILKWSRPPAPANGEGAAPAADAAQTPAGESYE